MAKTSLCFAKPSRAWRREAETTALLLLKQLPSVKWRKHGDASCFLSGTLFPYFTQGPAGWDCEEKNKTTLTTAVLSGLLGLTRPQTQSGHNEQEAEASLYTDLFTEHFDSHSTCLGLTEQVLSFVTDKTQEQEGQG